MDSDTTESTLTETVTPTSPENTPQTDTPAEKINTSDSLLTKLKNNKKLLIIGAAAAVVVIGGALAYYLGYYNSPSTIYSQSLSNTASGYDKLVDYVNTESKQNFKGATGSGSYTAGSSAFATDGKLTLTSDGDNADFTADVNIGSGRLGLDFRAIKSKSDSSTPDIYLKASGLKSVQQLASSDLGSVVTGLDDQWIMVDQTILDSVKQFDPTLSSTSSSKASQPTEAQIQDALQAVGTVNRQYVFTADKHKAVFTVQKNVGKETVDGHNTYHYKVGLDKANVKTYAGALRDAIKKSSLNDWLKKNNYENYVDLGYDSIIQSADNVKASDTFDVWMDASHRILYKVRFADPKNAANSYADIGLDYQGGSSYPFFINIYDKAGSETTTGSLGLTLNSDTYALGFSANFKQSGSKGFNFKANLNVTPTNNVKAITAPTGAKPLSQVLDQLGLGSYLSLLGSSSDSSSSASSGSPSADLYHECTLAEEAYFDNGTPVPAKCDALFQ